MKNVFAILAALYVLLTSALAHDEKPTIAFLRFAGTAPVTAATNGFLDSLEAYGYLSSVERAAISESFDLEGENVNLIYRDAGFDLASANLMVDEVLDKGADALIIITTQVAQIAVNATRDMEDPPAILFSLVSTPFATGIAESTCIKPGHVTGTQPLIAFEEYVPLVLVQDPDIKVIGTIMSPDHPTSVVGVEIISRIGQSLGLTVEVASAVTLADLNIAAESLLSRGAEAIVLVVNPLTLQGAPVLVQVTAEHGIPLYAPIIQQVFRGVTVGAGFYDAYEEGVIVAQLLHAHFNGDIDIAKTAINQSRSFGIAINLDTAAEQGIEISDELLARANFVIENGERSEGMASDVAATGRAIQHLSLEERRAVDLEFLAGLECTPEMIAEQQAALDAASE